MEKAKLILLIGIYLTILLGCSKAPSLNTTSTMITPAVTRTNIPFTPSITPTPIQTSLAAQSTSAAFLAKVKPESAPTSTGTPPPTLKEKLSEIYFPAWVSDPAANVLMLPIGSWEEGYTHLSLVNAETSEFFDLPKLNILAYFWMPDGKSLGMVDSDGNQILLLDLQSGESTPLRIDSVTEKYTNFESFYETPQQLNAFWASDTANGFFLFQMHQSVGPNGQYLVEESSDNHTMVTNLSSGEQQIVTPDEAYFDLFEDWNPAQPDQLAIQQSDVEMGMLYSFYTPPGLRIKIVNVKTGRSTNFIKDVFGAYPGMWSPDGRQLLYYQKMPTDVGLGKGNPPCLFDLINETSRCFNQLVALDGAGGDLESYTWSPTGKYLSYFYNGGLCLFNLSDEKDACFLQKLDHEEEVIRYQWSPDERYIVFQYDESCPACDFSTQPKIGILDLRSGSYEYISDMIAEQLGAWRPPIQAKNP
jgi:WD40 repeat protein